MSSRRPILSIDVPCPTCWAAPGYQCNESTDLTSPLLETPHTARVRAAVAEDDRRTSR